MPKKAETYEHEFRLFAPNNIAASLIADFSDWKDIPMNKGEDGYFRVTQRLPDGLYQYRFNIRSKSWFNDEDEWKTVTDPYATNVDPPTQNSILLLKHGKKIVDEYVWQYDAIPLPANNELVIYEMHVSDFSGGEPDDDIRGRYVNVIEKLDYLQRLGVNAIELMPLKTFPGDFNWGYSPVHYFAPESTYGTTAELKELIDLCHGAGIRVIVDGVYNHASTDNALNQIDHDYWFRREGKDPENNWGPEFDYERWDERLALNPASQFILDSIRYWIYEYRIDGIRFDAARQIDNFDVLRSFVSNAREMSEMKPFFTVAEYIPPTPEVTEPAGPVESCWNDSFMYTLAEYLGGEPHDLERIKNAIDPSRLGFASVTSVTNYLANHDQNRLFRRLGERGILGDELYRRARLGAAILMTAVGVPMIWMGDEFGEHSLISEESNKIRWGLLEHGDNLQLLEYYTKLIGLRTTHPALRAPGVEFFFEDHDAGVLCFTRHDPDSNILAVILNLSDNDHVLYTVTNFPLSGALWEFTKGFEIQVGESGLTLDLARREALIFVTL